MFFGRGRRSKYGGIRTELAGRSFASQLEAALYQNLLDEVQLGTISDLQCQKRVRLTEAEIIYIPDFSYTLVATGEVEYAEAKGFETPEWRIKRRLWEAYGPGRLKVWKGTAKRLRLHETLIPPTTGMNRVLALLEKEPGLEQQLRQYLCSTCNCHRP